VPLSVRTRTMNHFKYHDQVMHRKQRASIDGFIRNKQRKPSLLSIPEDEAQEINFEQHLPDTPQSLRVSSIVRDSNDDAAVTPFELVNLERSKYGLVQFRLSRTLNHLAQQQARRMARSCKLSHSSSSVDELKELLMSDNVAENIQRGDKVSSMHFDMMTGRNCMNQLNVLSMYLSDFGYGVATGRDGKVYCCQLFRS
jgi:uncharacterized protein YkwD